MSHVTIPMVVIRLHTLNLQQLTEWPKKANVRGKPSPRLTKEQSREVAPNPHMLATMKRLFEE